MARRLTLRLLRSQLQSGPGALQSCGFPGRCSYASASAASAGSFGRSAAAGALAAITAAALFGWAPATALADAPAPVAAPASGSAPACAANPAEELTYIMVKPDGVQRGLVSDILGRFERKGYKLVGIKVLVPTPALAAQHYAEHKGKPFFPKLVNFLASGPVVAMAWEGKDVVKYGRTMIGATNPLASAPGTIRGDFGVDTGRNIVHGSDSVESARRELALWFQSHELASYSAHRADWVYE